MRATGKSGAPDRVRDDKIQPPRVMPAEAGIATGSCDDLLSSLGASRKPTARCSSQIRQPARREAHRRRRDGLRADVEPASEAARPNGRTRIGRLNMGRERNVEFWHGTARG